MSDFHCVLYPRKLFSILLCVLQETRLELVFLGHEPNRLTITAFLLKKRVLLVRGLIIMLLGIYLFFYSLGNQLQVEVADEEQYV